jgi:oxygen-independent coproporphyrinogen-3 oxidase
MDDTILKHMNRGHGVREIIDSIEACRKAGFDDICIEYIYGYPNQSMQTWIETIQGAIATGVEEIQLYRLKIVPYGDARGPIETLYRKHPEQFPPLEDVLTMKQVAILLLNQAGYHENLTRVFTREPKYSSHYAFDQCCRLLDCLGIGLSAFSSLHDRFCINPDSMKVYADRIRSGHLPLNRGLVRDTDDALRWHFLLPLKNTWLIKKDYTAQTGHSVDVFRPEMDALAAAGLLVEDDQTVKLTTKGRFFADEVCTQFHHPRYMPFPRESYLDGPLYLSRQLDCAMGI